MAEFLENSKSGIRWGVRGGGGGGACLWSSIRMQNVAVVGLG